MTVATGPTIRERIRAIQTEFVSRSVTPTIVRQHLLLLNGLLGHVLDEARAADYDKDLIEAAFVEAGDAVNKAKVRTRATAQYRRAREAEDTKHLVVEMIRSCKKYLDSLDTEMRLAR